MIPETREIPGALLKQTARGERWITLSLKEEKTKGSKTYDVVQIRRGSFSSNDRGDDFCDDKQSAVFRLLPQFSNNAAKRGDWCFGERGIRKKR